MQKFAGVLDRVCGKELSQVQAAEVLGLSERTIRSWIDVKDRSFSGYLPVSQGRA